MCSDSGVETTIVTASQDDKVESIPYPDIQSLTMSSNLETVHRKPEISPKPVPAPRHLFMRKPSESSVLGQECELTTAWARRSYTANMVTTQSDDTTPPKDNEAEKENEPAKEIIINVKERAKSFSGIQNLSFVTPQPFRPSSIAQRKVPIS